jgi:hypothetical protein
VDPVGQIAEGRAVLGMQVVGVEQRPKFVTQRLAVKAFALDPDVAVRGSGDARVPRARLDDTVAPP